MEFCRPRRTISLQAHIQELQGFWLASGFLDEHSRALALQAYGTPFFVFAHTIRQHWQSPSNSRASGSGAPPRALTSLIAGARFPPVPWWAGATHLSIDAPARASVASARLAAPGGKSNADIANHVHCQRRSALNLDVQLQTPASADGIEGPVANIQATSHLNMRLYVFLGSQQLS